MSLVQNVHRIKIGNGVEPSRRRGAYRSPSSSSSTISSSNTRKREQRWKEHQRGSRGKSKLAHKIISATKDSHRKNVETLSETTTSYSTSVSDSESDTSHESSLDALVQRALSIPENKWMNNRSYNKNMKNERNVSALLDSKYNRDREHELMYYSGNTSRRNNNNDNNYFVNVNNISSKNHKNKLYDSNHVNNRNSICREKENREDKVDSDGVDVVSAHYIDRQSNNKQINKRQDMNYRASHDKQNRSASRYKVNGKLSLAIQSNNNSMGNNNEYNFTDMNNSNYGADNNDEENDFRFTRMLEELRLNAEKKQGKFASTNGKSKNPLHKERVGKHGNRHAAIKFEKATEARLTALNASTRAKKQEKYEVRKAKEQEQEQARNKKANSEHNKSSSPPSKRSIEAGERLYRLATSKEALLTRMRKEAKEEQNKVITKELTFKPTISKMAQELGSKDYQPLSLRSSTEFNTQMQRRRHSQLAQESRKLRQCTFHPTLAPFTEQIINARRQKEMRKWCARHNRKLHHTVGKTHRHSNSWRAKRSDISVMHERTSSLSSLSPSFFSSSSSSVSHEFSNKVSGIENYNSSRLRGMKRSNHNNKKRNTDRCDSRNHNTSHFSSHSPFKETSSLHHHHHHKNKGHQRETSHLHLNSKRRTAAAPLSSSSPPTHSRALLSSSTCHEPFDPVERLYHDGEERLLRQQIRQQMALDRAEAEMVGSHIKLSHDELQEVLARMEDWLNKRNERVALMREEIIRTETRNPLHSTEIVQRSASCAPRIGANNTISPCSPLSSFSSSSLTEQQEKEQQIAAKMKHDQLRRSATEFTHLQQSGTHEEQLHNAKKQQEECPENGRYRNAVVNKIQHIVEAQPNNTEQEQEQTTLPRDDVPVEQKHTKDKYSSDKNKLVPSSKNIIYKNGAAMTHRETEHLSRPPMLATTDEKLTNNISGSNNKFYHHSDATILPVSETSESTSPYKEVTSSSKCQKQENCTAPNKDHTLCVQYNNTQWTKAQWELRVIRYGALFYKYLPSTSTNTVRLSEIESQVHRIYPEDVELLAVLQARFGLSETVIDKEMFVSALTEFERNNGPQPWGWTEKDRLLYTPLVNHRDNSNNRISSDVYSDRKRITFPTIDSTTHHTHQDERTSGKEELSMNNKVNTSFKWRSARMPHACKHAVRISNTPAFKHPPEPHERITRAKRTNVHDDKCTFRPKLNKRSIQLSNEDKRKRTMKMHASLSRKIDVPKTIDKQTCMYADSANSDVNNVRNNTHSTSNTQASTMPSAELANETKRVSSSSHRAGLSPSVELSSLSSTEEYEMLNNNNNNNINNDIETNKSSKVTNTSKDASNTLHSTVGEWQHATKTTHDAVAELEFLLQSTQERVNALMQLEQANYDSDGNTCTNMCSVTRESLPSQITDIAQFSRHSFKEVRKKTILGRNDSNNNAWRCVQEEQKVDELSPSPSKPQLTTALENDNTKRLSNKEVNSNTIITDSFNNLFDSLYKSCSRSAKRS